jgi:hypothetical protein
VTRIDLEPGRDVADRAGCGFGHGFPPRGL